MKKSRNKIVKILVKSKSWNLLKYNFQNLSKFKKVQVGITIGKSNLLNLGTKVIFTKLRQIFT